MPDEVIIVDNNSTDKTVAIAKKYPFVHIITEKQQGIVHARNAGFNAAKGQILGRIDADSILPPDWSSYVRNYYADPDHNTKALTGGGYFYNIRAPRFNGWIQGQLAARANRLVTGHYILWGSNMAFPRVLWQKVQKTTCTRQDVHEDLDLAIHLHELGYEIDYHEDLRIGAYLRRVWSNRDQQHAHMQRWPRTLRVHNYRHWWVGVAGNIFLWYLMQPLVFIAEGLSRFIGKKPIR
jgi:glycosyltransferase involved in cell wall biosynthesis